MQSRPPWDFFDMQIKSANKGGRGGGDRDEGFFCFFLNKIQGLVLSWHFCSGLGDKAWDTTILWHIVRPRPLLRTRGHDTMRRCTQGDARIQVFEHGQNPLTPVHISQAASDMNLVPFAIQRHWAHVNRRDAALPPSSYHNSDLLASYLFDGM